MPKEKSDPNLERVKEIVEDIQAKMGELDDILTDINDKIDEVLSELGAV